MYFIRRKILCTTKPLSISFYKINGCIKDYKGSKYLILIPSDEKGEGLLTKYNKMFDTFKSFLKEKEIIQMIARIHTCISKSVPMIT